MPPAAAANRAATRHASRVNAARRTFALATGTICALAAFGALATKAGADPSSTATATISMPIRSVTLSTTTLTYANCTGGDASGNVLGSPNGKCTTNPITITNSGSASVIEIVGSDAVPSDGGKHWTLCGRLPACSPNPLNPGAPGTDQFTETVGGSSLELTPICDPDLSPRDKSGQCQDAGPGRSLSETLALTGPRSSTDASPQFTTQITWTATG